MGYSITVWNDIVLVGGAPGGFALFYLVYSKVYQD